MSQPRPGSLVPQERCQWFRVRRVIGLGPDPEVDTLPVGTFTVDGLHHALVAACLSVEYGIGVRHGCFCAHPYLLRLLDLTPGEVADYHAAVRAGDRRAVPGAIRASAGLSTSTADVDLLLTGVRQIAGLAPAPLDYEQDPHTGDFWPTGDLPGWTASDRPSAPPAPAADGRHRPRGSASAVALPPAGLRRVGGTGGGRGAGASIFGWEVSEDLLHVGATSRPGRLLALAASHRSAHTPYGIE